MTFAGISVQIEELLSPVIGIVDVLVPAVGQRRPVVVAVAHGVLKVDEGAPIPGPSADRSQQALSVEMARDGRSGGVEEGRQDIPQFDRLRQLSASLPGHAHALGPPQNHGDFR